MSKRKEIIHLTNKLIRHKGYNAFSFYEISDKVGIKTASIHYHFPTKADLAVAVIESDIENLSTFIEKHTLISPLEKLDRFFTIYENILNQNRICLVGSLATDFNTLDTKVQTKLKVLSELMLNWVCEFLEEGKSSGVFYFLEPVRTKALTIITNMLAIVQLSRLTTKSDFEILKISIKNSLIK